MSSASILLVEDDPNLRDMIETILAEEEYQVVSAVNADQAITAAAAHEFQLVLTDVRLGSMDGLECLREVRRAQPGVRAIVITGYASEDVPARAIRGRADDYIYKPFELVELLTAVERVLERAQEGRRYHAMLSSVVAGDRGIERGSLSLEDARDRAFSAFFVGVRSRRLERQTASDLWRKLEGLEARRISVLDDDSEEPEDVLAGDFFGLSQEVADSADGKTPDSSLQPGAGLNPQLFANLFANVLAGKVSIELLKRATFLRTMDQGLVQGSQQLQELYSSVWET